MVLKIRARPMTAIAQTLLLGAVSVGILFLLMWGFHLFIKNAGIVDVGWGFGFILLCLLYIVRGQGFNLRDTICFLMVLLWGVRIISYLFRRLTAEKGEDK